MYTRYVEQKITNKKNKNLNEPGYAGVSNKKELIYRDESNMVFMYGNKETPTLNIVLEDGSYINVTLGAVIKVYLRESPKESFILPMKRKSA